jgi:hypothetical protein
MSKPLVEREIACNFSVFSFLVNVFNFTFVTLLPCFLDFPKNSSTSLDFLAHDIGIIVNHVFIAQFIDKYQSL